MLLNSEYMGVNDVTKYTDLGAHCTEKQSNLL